MKRTNDKMNLDIDDIRMEVDDLNNLNENGKTLQTPQAADRKIPQSNDGVAQMFSQNSASTQASTNFVLAHSSSVASDSTNFDQPSAIAPITSLPVMSMPNGVFAAGPSPVAGSRKTIDDPPSMGSLQVVASGSEAKKNLNLQENVQLEIYRPNGHSFFVSLDENEIEDMILVEVVETFIKESSNTDEDIRKTPTCWLELCGHHHDMASYGQVLERNQKALSMLRDCCYTVLILVKPFQEDGESYVDVLDKKCPTLETAKYVIDQMTDEELNRDYVQERHGAMNLLQYCREKESVVLAIIGSLPRFTRMLDPHPERHQSCLSDACRLGQRRAVEAIFDNTHTPEELITCPNEHRATYLHQACYNGHLAIVDYILCHNRFPSGLDLWVRGNTHNATCMHLACCRPQLPVAQFLINHPKCPRDLINWGNKHSATCLHLACEDAHIQVVEFLVTNIRCREEKLILQQNKNGFTCLHLAIQKGHLEVVKCLLNNSDSATVAALIPLQTKNGNTCFHITCQEGFTHIMELLWFNPDVPKDEMVGCQDKDGYNCLNDACYYGHLPLIEFFFNHWPRDDGPGAGTRPARKRSGQNEPKFSNLDSSASSGGPNTYGGAGNMIGGLALTNQNVLNNQAAGGPESPSVVQEGLFSDQTVDMGSDQNWDDDISLVSQDERFPSLTQLIFSVTGGIGNCLHVACSRGHLSIVEFLCTAKNKSSSGQTGLGNITGGQHAYGGRRASEEAEQMESNNNDADHSSNGDDSSECGPEQFYNIEDLVLSKNKHNATGLHLASIKGHLEIAKFLVDNTGLSRDKKRDFMGCQNKKGASCLHFACYHGNVEVVKFLVNHPDCPKELVHARNRNHYTCLHSACDEGRFDVIEFLCTSQNFPIELLAAQARSNTILHKVCEYGYMNIVKLLVSQSIAASERMEYTESGFKPDTLVTFRNNLGDTCLHVAAAEGHLLIVDYLVKTSVAEKYNLLFSKNKQDMTCLQLACSEGHLTVVEFLMNWCTTEDPTGKRKELLTHSLNVYHATCLFSACEAGHTAIVEFLIEHKHFPVHILNAQTKYGTSCLHAACEKGYLDIVQLLMNHKHCSRRLILCKDRGGASCLDLAKCEGHSEIIDFVQNHPKWGMELVPSPQNPDTTTTALNFLPNMFKKFFGRPDGSRSP